MQLNYLQHTNSKSLCLTVTEFLAFIGLQYAYGLYENNHSVQSKKVRFA